jgi:hypothetical protein
MGAKGVLIVTSSSQMWVGPQPACRFVFHEMREVRSLDSIVLCNFTGKKLDVGLDVEVIDMDRSWAGPPFMPAVYQGVLDKKFGETVLCCHACTPLVPAAAMEKCVEAVLGGKVAAQTVVKTEVALQSEADHWEFKIGATPVLGARAFRASQVSAWDQFGTSIYGEFEAVPVTKKQGLSLLDEGDLELIQALEHSGRI